VTGGVVAVTSDGTSLSVTVDGVTTTQPLDSVSGLDVTAGTLTIDAAAGSISAPITFTGGSLAIVNSQTASDWTLNGDGTGSVAGGGISSLTFSQVTSISAGGTADTLHGPSSDSTWTISGAGSGSVAGTSFDGFENLSGAADNKDTFVLDASGSLSGVADGGDGGYDSLVVNGSRDSIVSNATGAHSGTLVIDGAAFQYAGLEPLGINATNTNITINGADLGGSTEVADKDLLKVSPYSDPSATVAACQTPGNCIQVHNFDAPLGITDIAEWQYFVISGTQSLTINGGLGADTVEFTGDYLVPNSSLTVNAEHIKVDPGVTINVGSASGNNLNLNAVYKDDGLSVLGLTTTIPVLGVDALVDVNSATLTGNKISLTAFAGTLSTTVNGTGQDLSGGNLVVASVAGFDNSSGYFTVDGGTGTCHYTGRDIGTNKLTGITGCTGTPADKAVVTSGVTENGSGKGVNHAGVELEYYANVNIYGTSTLTASYSGSDPAVNLASNVDVISVANAVPVKGTWTAGVAYSKGDVVIDPNDNKRYSAKDDISAVNNTDAPDIATSLWDDATSESSAVAASTFIAHAITHLSDASVITAANGKVSLSSNLKSNITTTANALQSGSGAGIAVAVLVTDSEAYIDSTAATPLTAQSLSISADTDNAAPTTATAAHGGADKGGSETSANSPTQGAFQTSAAGGKADKKSNATDSSGNKANQDFSAALGVFVVVATTQAFISPKNGTTFYTINLAGGSKDLKIHAGSKNVASATADAGNVKFSPDAPTPTASTTGGSLPDGTYYYKVSAWNAMGESPKSNEASVTPAVPPSKPYDLVAEGGVGQVSLRWLPPIDDGGSQVTGYRVYKGTSPGGETLLVTLGNALTYIDGGLTKGTTYYYQVTAMNVIGEGPRSFERSATTASEPSAPRDLHATAGDGQVRLSWSAPSFDGGAAVSNYRIYRGNSPSGEIFYLELGSVLSYTDTGLTNGLAYYYVVSAVNVIGEGTSSGESGAIPMAPPVPPSAPLNLAASAGNTQVTLTWEAPSSDGGTPITGYRIYAGASSSGKSLVAQTGIQLTFVDWGLTNGQPRFYEVAAMNSAGEGAKSNEASATPRTVPGQPTDFKAVAGNGQVTLSWTAPSEDGGSQVTAYKVYRGTLSGQLTLLATLGDVLTYSDTGLTNGQVYYYMTSAVSSFGDGPGSNVVSATPQNRLPTCLIDTPLYLSSISGTVTVSGTASDQDGTVVRVEVRIDDGTWQTVTGTTPWSYSWDTGGVSDGQHKVYARSFDGDGYSGLAQTTVTVANAAPQGGSSTWMIGLAILILLAVLVFYFLKIRPKSREKAEEKNKAGEKEKPPAK